MSTLPNADNAIADEHKICQYLLSSTHPTGRAKAAFFRQFGFSPEKWRVFQAALLEHAGSHPVARCDETEFGSKVVVDGSLNTPSGRRPLVRTVWFLSAGEIRPRLVTAYPLREERV